MPLNSWMVDDYGDEAFKLSTSELSPLWDTAQVTKVTYNEGDRFER